MYEEEIAKIKAEFAALPKEDDAGRTRLSNQLETVLGLAFTRDDAKRYMDQVKKVEFYPMSFIPDGGPDWIDMTWTRGRLEVVALIESVEHHLRLKGEQSKQVAPKASNKVFIVHGRDHGMLRDVEAFVRKIGVEPVIIMDEANRGATVMEKFEKQADVPFAVVLFSPDDIGGVFGDPPEKMKRRPRQNAVFELGFFVGKLGRENTALIVDATLAEDTENPSDLGGVIPIYYRPDSDWKTRLMREFKASDIKHDATRA